ncbi:MAG TPA: hypothetical protein VIG33_05980 [Pseudobdellovibrionaceae bacterium]
MNTEIQNRLEKLAYKRTQPFCYSCYKETHSGTCESCRSDDLMRLMVNVGCDYGVDWAIKYILESELTPVNLSRAFEDSVRECYPKEVTVGWMTLDSISVMKAMDPIFWQCAQSEWEEQEAREGNIISFDSGLNYYYQTDIENFLDQEEH